MIIQRAYKSLIGHEAGIFVIIAYNIDIDRFEYRQLPTCNPSGGVESAMGGQFISGWYSTAYMLP
jgi:hypothetical protein